MNRKVRLALAATAVLVIAAAGFGWWRTGEIVVYAGAKPEALPAAPAATEFSVIAYNVQARPWFDETDAKFKGIGPLLNNYDIAALQEFFKDQEDLRKLTAHPVFVYDTTLLHPLKITNSGLAIAGKHPLVKTAHHLFTVPGDFQNRPASKGVLMASFLVGGLPVDVYTSHFAAGRKEESVRDKPVQTREAVEFVKANSPPEHAVIFLGDFNMKTVPEEERMSADALAKAQTDYAGLSREDCLQVLTAALELKNAALELHPEILDVPDQILYRSGSQARLELLRFQLDGPEFYFAEGKPMSDHSPITAEFRIAPAANEEVLQ